MMDAALPPVAFTLPDDEMLTRLRSIYSEQTVDAIAKRWKDMRARGLGSVVDERKERYCRRMYNVSQFAKTLKESLSRWYNATYDHTGCLWEGRFYSSLVERTSDVLAIVSAYIAYNPVKAGIAATPADWRWSSYAKAVRGANAVDLECRRLYERMLNRSWDEVRDMLEAIYADKLPEDVRPDDVCASFDDYDEDVATERPLAPRSLRASQVIRVTLKCFARGAYLSADFDWLKSVKAALPPRFPAAGSRSVKRCRAFLWHLPDHARRAA